jgi:hypothetical protein
MHLRKVLTVGAAVLAAGLLTLSSAATASNPTGAAPTVIEVNGNATAGTPAIDGIFKGGTASFGGGTFGCTGGTVAGTVTRGPIVAGQNDLSFTTLTIVCATPLGVNATISLPAGCVVSFRNNETNTHAGTVDTGTYAAGAKFHHVRGNVIIGAPKCAAGAKITVPGGCSANVTGTVPAYFDEAIKVVGGVNYQDLGLNGAGLTLSGQTFLCFGLLTGGVTLNNIVFNVQVTGGTTTGIDFRP